MARLGDVCKIQSGGTPSRAESAYWYNGSIPWVKISDIKDKYLNNTEEHITEAGLENSSAKIFPAGTILYTIFATLGETCILNIDASTNQAIAGIQVESNLVFKEYLYYYLLSQKNAVSQMGRGVAQNNINMKMLREFEIPLPPLEEQRRIAALLDKVSDLIAKRQTQLDKLDLLVKARFVEMFGDPETNPMNWPIVGIGTITKTIDSGWSGNGKQREKKSGEIAVLKVSAVTKGYFIPEECKVLDDQENIKKYVFPQKGDLLFSRANTKEMVGATAIIKEDYPDLILPDKLWKIRFSDVTNVVYMKYILSSKAIRNKFSAASTGTSGSMYNVSMEKFKAIQIPMPEISMQNQFASFAESTEKLKSTIQQSLEKLETLKKALMQQYFG